VNRPRTGRGCAIRRGSVPGRAVARARSAARRCWYWGCLRCGDRDLTSQTPPGTRTESVQPGV